MKTLHLLVFGLQFISNIAFADTWLPPKPRTTFSPLGNFSLQSLPPDHIKNDKENLNKTILIINKFDKKLQTSHEIGRFSIEELPVDIFINNKGDRIVTFDRYFAIGHGPRVVAIYDSEGRELKKWALKDFYDSEKITKLGESTSSIHWRSTATWLSNQEKILIKRPTQTQGKDKNLDDYLIDVRELKINKIGAPK